VKEQVREFYDSVGWKVVGEGLYQNARYEDLRPVSRDYIHRCHLRVQRFIPQEGKYLLDAGSGPIQYPEYLEYSKGFKYRVCLDISILALREARERIGNHGLYVQADIANLPFGGDTFEGTVSLHTIHHLPDGEHEKAFTELVRILKPGGKAAVVYSWGNHSPLMSLVARPLAWATGILEKRRLKRGIVPGEEAQGNEASEDRIDLVKKPGTFTFKHNYQWIRSELKDVPGLEIRVWRSVSTAFLRTFIHQKLLGRLWLGLIYLFEELMPRILGRFGQYPLILFGKPESTMYGER
jgi:SAM-dependent methyltransferase